ncbi:MAG: RNA polymerase sigma factor [Muribaculaceae bacterium]|nr:RNA polymerase sigma factor [Muribaculaceae bacterium]
MKTSNSFADKIIDLQGNLMNFAIQLTADREAAEDLLQDTTLKALDNEDKYVDNVNFKGWIFTIMRNIFINNYRQTVRKATVVDTTEDLYLLNISQESGLDTPEGSFAVQEISSAVNAFPEEYRVPFNMYVAGYKYNEIAEKLNLPLGTIKSRIFSARQKLRDQLQDYAS